MSGPEDRGGRGAGGSGEAQAQGQPRDSAMAPMQPSLGPPRDEPKVFGLEKFNGDNFAEWSFRMENGIDHCNLLKVMEGMENRPEIYPEEIPWVRKSAQGYLLFGQAFGNSQIRHIKPFQREPEKGPKAWAALKGVHAPATAAVSVVLERQMAALRIEEDEAVEEGVQIFFDLFTRLEGADLNYSELQKNTNLLALLPESWSSLIINLNRDLPRLSLEDVKRAILQEDFRRSELASADGAGAASIGREYGRGRGRGRKGGRFGSNNFNGGRGSGRYGSDKKSYGRGRGRFDGECHYCHKSGHMWHDCFKLPNRWSRDRDNRDLPYLVVEIPILMKVPKNPLANPCGVGLGSLRARVHAALLQPPHGNQVGSKLLRPTIFPSAPLNMALPMPFTSARWPKADVTCFTGDGSSSVSKSARGVML
ncbi:unnamed protein product [Closterium sp. NIES-54]